MATKTKKKAMTGFVSGAYANNEYDYPTHTLVTLDNKDIKKILKLMDKVNADKDISAVVSNVGGCEYFRISAKDLDKAASLLGVQVDALSNVSVDTFYPIFQGVDEATLNSLVEIFRTGGTGEAEVNAAWVVWKATEKYSGMLMESPCISRSVLEKWLKGDFT